MAYGSEVGFTTD